jgi:hypothetical protein
MPGFCFEYKDSKFSLEIRPESGGAPVKVELAWPDPIPTLELLERSSKNF